MKKIIITFLLISAYSFYGQHPDLQNKKWYVKNVTINNITTEIPTDLVSFPFTRLRFSSGSTGYVGSNNLDTNPLDSDYNCKMGFNGHVNYTANNIFSFIDFSPYTTTSDCTVSLQNFMNLYVSFFNNEITENFTYTIINETDGTQTLTITNNNGDEAVFTDTFYIAPPEELTNTNLWYLHNLIIDDINYTLPNNSEITTIPLSFNYQFETGVCAPIVGAEHFDISSNNFYLYELAIGLTDCGIPDNNNFQNTYFNFFINAFPGPFHYQLTANGADQTLTITTENGDQAVYGNTVLATENYTNKKVAIYPNPTSNSVTIDNETDEQILNILLYNNLGQLVGKTKSNTINLTNFNNGLYLLHVKFMDGSQVIKKIVKF